MKHYNQDLESSEIFKKLYDFLTLNLNNNYIAKN